MNDPTPTDYQNGTKSGYGAPSYRLSVPSDQTCRSRLRPAILNAEPPSPKTCRSRLRPAILNAEPPSPKTCRSRLRPAILNAEASHDREVVHRGEVEVLGLQLEWQVVVDAVVADLEQEVARLAASERPADALVVVLDQVIDSRLIDLWKPSLGANMAIIFRNISSVGSVALIL